MQRVPEEGILKRSSAFLASLAHPSARVAERNLPSDEYAARFHGQSAACGIGRSASPRHACLRGYFSILSSADDDTAGTCALQRSPSVQTLSTSWKKKGGVGVKKSVSFSSDTSFEEKRASCRKPAVHEAKVYRKGVLQGECATTYEFPVNVP